MPSCPFANMNPDTPMTTHYQPVVWKEVAVKAAVTAAVAGVAAYALLDGQEKVSFMSFSLPSAVPLAVGAAGGSVAADLAHNYILPLIPNNQKYEKAEHAALSIAASGLGSYAVANIFGSPSFVPVAGIGAGSFVAADYAYHNFINKSEGGLLF